MATFKDISLLIARVLLGIILIAHGWQKFSEWALLGTAEAFAGMGVPAPTFSSAIAAIVELFGGVLILAGAFTPIVGVIVALQMLGAFFFAHMGNGVFVDNGGFELVGVIAAASLALAGAGAGRFSVDQLIDARRATR
ncbi:DoxX family protein [Corynebacterium lipophiloflavum]|uniref:DoxX family protein n=1 Tax=Corynebacterium lipophiloflavum (strain ATCC 700352 / DSM 44291 / CCUG 37336 / JCM 10383 / DMMZ 1944) TaxID=525263 RepID=C0XQ26_CORLD|nr:DoxX family protein [Corynebacterium lipophiloflavum]EEI17670.1 DoxX family protein [Corynebacterium lipophiloflavum DSM 44291]